MNEPTTVQAGAGLIQVSTDTVCARDKVSYWADMVCRHMVQAECNSVAEREQFHGAIQLRKIGKVDISQVAGGAMEVARTPQLITEAGSEYIVVNIQREGNSACQQDGRVVTLKAGQMALFSSSREFDFSFSGNFSQTVLIFQADVLRRKIPSIDTLTATALASQNPVVRLLTRMADSYSQTEFEALPPAAVAHSADALTELLAATVATFLPKNNIADLAIFHLMRIKGYVLENLHEPTLSVASVSQALRLSPAHIHRLFAGESQTLSAWLWSCRLLACKNALESDAQAHLTISEVAFRNGFNNCSHFSRAFREKFGMSPSECRDRHIADNSSGA